MVAELLPRSEQLAWLTRSDVIRPDGAVMSWVNPDNPGYPYPEIAGYMLSFLALEGPSTIGLRDRIVRRLARDLTPNGAVGRGGIEYVFDSAMVLAGVLAHEATGGSLPDPQLADRLHAFVSSNLRARSGLRGQPDAPSTHWSASYGCHLIKTVIALTAYADRRSTRGTDALVEQLLADLLPLYDGGRFRVNADSDDTYTHAHCYALEGLLTLEGRGSHSLRAWIEGGADWLAGVQEADGGVPATHTSAGPVMAAHADCTAQAVRIWTCVDPGRYADNIDRAVGYLTQLTVEGGICYQRGSDDVNTWVTIFGAQAIDWSENGGRWQWIV